MSAAQLRASERFISAMGPMVNDEQKVNQVIVYINTLSGSQQPDGKMTRAERDSKYIPLDESERTTLEMHTR